MNGRDESAGRGGADQHAFDTQDGRDGQRDPLPADYGEPPETLQVIPGRFLRDPLSAANPGGASPVNAPSGGPLSAPAYPPGAGFPRASQPSPAAPSTGPNSTSASAPSSTPSRRYPTYQAGHSSGSEVAPTSSSTPSTAAYSQPFAQRGPRSVPVLSRYPTPGSATPSQLQGALGAAAAGAIAGGAVAAALPVPAQRSQGQPAPANGATPAGTPAVASRSQRPYVVEEVQEAPVRDVPITNPAMNSPMNPPANMAAASSQRNGWERGYAQAGAVAAPRGGTQPFARSAVPSEPYSYQPFVPSGAQPAIEPWREPARAASRPARGAVLAPAEVAPVGDRGLMPGIHAAPNGYVTITLNANNAAGFSYLFGWLSGIFFYFTERANHFVRFHAWQSILLTVLYTILAPILYLALIVLTTSPHDTFTVTAGVVGIVLAFVAMFFVWLYAMIAAWTGHYLRLPILWRLAEYFAIPAQDSYQPGDANAAARAARYDQDASRP